MDIRGHGQSEAPLDAESYTTGALWADDVKNVIEALKLDRPVFVGWSYAGLIRRSGVVTSPMIVT